MSKICVLGGGAWGSALACVVRRAGHETVLWSRNRSVVNAINQNCNNPDYLGNLPLESDIQATTELPVAIESAKIVLFAVPAQTIGEMAKSAAKLIKSGAINIACAKGIDRETALLPSELIANEIPDCAVAALSGPSFASDVVQKLPTAITIASKDMTISQKLAASLSTEGFRCYASDDLKGVELGGALKNVLALAVGAARGMQLGASAEAALIARGFAEICRLAVALGAEQQTLSGLSGLGDLVLTCSTPQSRNFSYGMALGHGDDLQGLKLAEGAFTARIAAKIAIQQNIDTPIIKAVTAVLDKELSAKDAVVQLLRRPLKSENK
ncbi:MAG: NAD(P)H-dependent glycerol-3-phosphate dehydrogenase [Rhizobiaceae bacterium]